MGAAWIPLQVDIGFGDTVEPAPRQEQLLALLDFPSAKMLVYPWETVIAEKFQAIVELGMDNSRMKDFFDLHHLAGTQVFDGQVLARAIQMVFTRRATTLPDGLPTGLQAAFGQDHLKQTQWQAFTRKLHMGDKTSGLDIIITQLQAFLIPPVSALLSRKPFAGTWQPGGPWKAPQ